MLLSIQYSEHGEGGSPCNKRRFRPKRVTSFRLAYIIRVARISRVEVYEKVGEFVISVFFKRLLIKVFRTDAPCGYDEKAKRLNFLGRFIQ